jgi:hypothetical protein
MPLTSPLDPCVSRWVDTTTVLTLLLHCCYTTVILLLHCCYTVVTLLLHCSYTAATLLLFCCYTVVTLLGAPSMPLTSPLARGVRVYVCVCVCHHHVIITYTYTLGASQRLRQRRIGISSLVAHHPSSQQLPGYSIPDRPSTLCHWRAMGTLTRTYIYTYTITHPNTHMWT